MKRKVLLVDDRPELLILLRTFLSRSYEVITAQSVAQAMGRISNGFFPDVVVTDLMMPDADGRVLVTQFKASKVYGTILIIILSIVDSSNDRIDLLRLGADDYITKPFNPEELDVRIQKVIMQ